MEIIGTIKKVLDPVSGENEKGFWTRRAVIIEPVNTQRNICVEYSGEEWSKKLGALDEGELLKVYFNVESNEFEGKWYTRLKGYGMQPFTRVAE